jgi:hypothetical protein
MPGTKRQRTGKATAASRASGSETTEVASVFVAAPAAASDGATSSPVDFLRDQLAQGDWKTIEEWLEAVPVTISRASQVESVLEALEGYVAARRGEPLTPREGPTLIRALWRGLMARTSGMRDWQLRARAMRLLSAALPVDDRSHVNLRNAYASLAPGSHWPRQIPNVEKEGAALHASAFISRSSRSTNETDTKADITKTTTITMSGPEQSHADTTNHSDDQQKRTHASTQGMSTESTRPEQQPSMAPSPTALAALLRMLGGNVPVDATDASRVLTDFLPAPGDGVEDKSSDISSWHRSIHFAGVQRSLIQTYNWVEACAVGALDASLLEQLRTDDCFQLLLLLRIWMFSLRVDHPSWVSLRKMIWQRLEHLTSPRSLHVLRHICQDEEHRWMVWKGRGCPRFERTALEPWDASDAPGDTAGATGAQMNGPALPWFLAEMRSAPGQENLNETHGRLEIGSLIGMKEALTPPVTAWFRCRYARAHRIDWLLAATEQQLPLETFLDTQFVDLGASTSAARSDVLLGSTQYG